MIDIRVLGTLKVHRPDGDASAVEVTQPKRLALLLYLVLAAPAGPKSRESLMALLWPEADTESARHSLRNALYGLRQNLGESAFVSRGEGYVGLDAKAVRCDALEVRRLLAERKWEEAIAAWGGELLPGFHVSGATEFERWLDEQRTSLRRAVTDAAWRRVDELERSGGAGLVQAAQRAWSLDPADEAGARRLMRFLDAMVGRAAALRAYAELTDYLRRECETEPSAETVALAQKITARKEAHADGPGSPAAVVHDVASSRVARAPGPGSWIRAGAAAAIVLTGMVTIFTLRASGRPSLDGTDEPARPAQDSALRLPARYRQDTAAYASYLRGLALRFSTPQHVSRDTFAALVKREPLYAPGLSGLAHAYALATIAGDMPASEGWPKVEVAARRALALDSASASAYLALGAREMFWRWNLPRARELIDRGIALEPADPEAHAILGTWFRWRRQMDSAVAEARTSVELDPLNPLWTWRLARQLFLARRYGEAESVYRRTIREYPERRRACYDGLSELYRATGRMREALAMTRAGAEVAGDTTEAARVPSSASEAAAERWFAHRAQEQLRALRDSMSIGDWNRPYVFAHASATMHDRDETLRWLDSMVVWRDTGLPGVLLDPAFDFVRSDPRYRAWEASLPWR